MLKRFLKDESGQGMVEYGLILALVALVAIAGLTVLGGTVKDKFNDVNTQISGGSSSETPTE